MVIIQLRDKVLIETNYKLNGAVVDLRKCILISQEISLYLLQVEHAWLNLLRRGKGKPGHIQSQIVQGFS